MVKVKALHKKLCKKFKIYPNLKFLNRTTNSFYDCKTNTIEISSKPWQGWKMPLVHEFAHALDYYKNGDNSGIHNYSFYENLIEVIDVSYRSRKQYKWECEYDRIKLWAIKDGFYNE